MSYLIARGDDGRDVSISLMEPVEIGRGDKDFTVVVRAGSGIVLIPLIPARAGVQSHD